VVRGWRGQRQMRKRLVDGREMKCREERGWKRDKVTLLPK